MAGVQNMTEVVPLDTQRTTETNWPMLAQTLRQWVGHPAGDEELEDFTELQALNYIINNGLTLVHEAMEKKLRLTIWKAGRLYKLPDRWESIIKGDDS